MRQFSHSRNTFYILHLQRHEAGAAGHDRVAHNRDDGETTDCRWEPWPSAAALCCIRCQGEGQDPRLSTVNLAACLGSAVVHFYTLW